MNQNKKTVHRVPLYRRPIIIVSCLILVIIIVVVVILVAKIFSKDEGKIGESSEENETVLVYSGENEENTGLSAEDQKVIVQYEGENPNTLEYLTGLITYTEVKDGALLAMVSIDQYLSTGTCTASLKDNTGVAIRSEQAVEADASTSHCAVNLNLAGVSGGKYQLEVIISSDGKTGTLTSEVEI